MSSIAKLGAFVLVALVVLGVFIVNIEKIPLGSRGEGTRVRAAFDSVAGLDEKSPVRIAGVRVGISERVSLEGDRALVTLLLDSGVEVRQGARAEVRSLGLLGEEYVELDPGPKGNPPLPADAILEGESATGFDQVLRTASGVGTDLKGVTESLRGALGGAAGQRRIEDILENVRQLSADLRALVAENRAEVGETLANFREFSGTLREELPKLAAKLNRLADGVDGVVADNRENIDATMANVREISAKLRTTADNLNEITGKIARGEGSIGKLVHDEATVDNLNATLKSVEGGVESLRNTIGRAERWGLDVAVRAEALPGISDSRTAFGFDLHTTDRRFLRAGLVDSPQGRTRTTSESVTVTLPDGSKQTFGEEHVETTDAFTWNAQIGYRLGATALRAGLFESTGGVAVDRSLLDDRLGLSLEAFDFGRDEKAPHLRLEGRWFLNRNVFAYTGWDDPTWSSRSSVILGAGITWRDEDLKYLLGTAASVGR